jgi:hypothetical protein
MRPSRGDAVPYTPDNRALLCPITDLLCGESAFTLRAHNCAEWPVIDHSRLDASGWRGYDSQPRISRVRRRKPKRLKSFQYTNGKLVEAVSKFFVRDGSLVEISISRFEESSKIAHLGEPTPLLDASSAEAPSPKPNHRSSHKAVDGRGSLHGWQVRFRGTHLNQGSVIKTQ